MGMISGRHWSHEEKLMRAAEAAGYDTPAAAARAMGVRYKTLCKAIKYAAEQTAGQPAAAAPEIIFPSLPAKDAPLDQVLDLLTEQSERYIRHTAAKEWQNIRIRTREPVVVAFMGDPHLGAPGCNMKLLRRDVALMQRPGVYAVNIGDSTNNWVGGLMRLYAEQETSASTERRLVKWLMNEAGIRWLMWVLGNHDVWNNGDAIHALLNVGGLPIEDWEAKFILHFDTGLEVPIWANHNFKGHSQYNKVHGALRAARERRGAVVFACGHTHDWALYHEELPDNGEVYWALRSRGYKFVDSYAVRNGFPSSQLGASTAVVIDPREVDDPRRAIMAFSDLALAVRYRDAIATT